MAESDIDLVRLAQGGDIAGLALLLERHRARLHATAVSALGPGPDAEDLVHDVFLVAVRAVGSLRDPAAAGGWLVGIARNLCLQRLRERRALVPMETFAREELSHGEGLEAILEAHALGDWVWATLGELAEPLRTVVVLRYFSRASRYEDIAQLLGVPVGTVRSRLSVARRKLAAGLELHADDAHDDHVALVEARRSFFLAVNQEYNQGAGCERLVSALAADAVLTSAVAGELCRGPEAIGRALADDLEAGMRLEVQHVVAEEEITVVEGAFENPPDDPDHCPPLTTQVFLHRGEQIRAIRLHYGANA